MGGWAKDVFNNNNLPLTLDQASLRVQVQTWLAVLYKSGWPMVDFGLVSDRFSNANYNDLVMVWQDFMNFGFAEETVYMGEDED